MGPTWFDTRVWRGKRSGVAIPRWIRGKVAKELREVGQEDSELRHSELLPGDQVILAADTGTKPEVARDLQTMNTNHGTLFNKEGLPASPCDWI